MRIITELFNNTKLCWESFAKFVSVSDLWSLISDLIWVFYKERREESRLMTVITVRPVLAVITTVLLLTGSGCTTCCSWASCRLFTTSSMSIISWFCSIISRGGRLGPLQVSRGQRQTVTCSEERMRRGEGERRVQSSSEMKPFRAGSLGLHLWSGVNQSSSECESLTLMILTMCWEQTAPLYLL